MPTIVGIKFKKNGKVYHFAPNNQEVAIGDTVIVETQRGVEAGEVAVAPHDIDESAVKSPLKDIIRKATAADLKILAENKQKEKEAFVICNEKIKKHGLDMKLVEVEYAFDGTKILFYFTADGRVDFRELVKDLATEYHTRIELRQIGARDEAKTLGSIGICGFDLCCSKFLDDFESVSIKMAKEQNLSPNPSKISGACGRLMCCLKYEQETYDELLKITPKVGETVDTPDGRGVVDYVNLLRGILDVTIEKDHESLPKKYSVDEIKIVKSKKTEKIDED